MSRSAVPAPFSRRVITWVTLTCFVGTMTLPTLAQAGGPAAAGPVSTSAAEAPPAGPTLLAAAPSRRSVSKKGRKRGKKRGDREDARAGAAAGLRAGAGDCGGFGSFMMGCLIVGFFLPMIFNRDAPAADYAGRSAAYAAAYSQSYRKGCSSQNQSMLMLGCLSTTSMLGVLSLIGIILQATDDDDGGGSSHDFDFD